MKKKDMIIHGKDKEKLKPLMKKYNYNIKQLNQDNKMNEEDFNGKTN